MNDYAIAQKFNVNSHSLQGMGLYCRHAALAVSGNEISSLYFAPAFIFETQSTTYLGQRDYPLAKEYAAQTAADPNPKYPLASARLSALIAKETLGKNELDSYYDKLIELDNDIDTREDARVELRLAERELKSLRKQHGVR